MRSANGQGELVLLRRTGPCAAEGFRIDD